MSFEHPSALFALILIPLLALFEWRGRGAGARALIALIGRRRPHPLLAQRGGGDLRGMLLRHLALTAFVIGAAGPQWGRETVRRESTGSDVVFVIDVSASMDTRDVAPSRIDEARREAFVTLERMAGSRVGVVAFAGDAVRLCPLTLDQAAVRLSLETLSSATVSTPGTDLARGLRAARKLLPSGRREEQAVVLWTDGEDLEGGAQAAIREMKSAGIRVFCVGVGTPAGDIVPLLDEHGRAIDAKKDESGSLVRSRLDERLLRDLARRTGGGYFSASRPGGELPRLFAAMGTLARSSRGLRLVERPVARFPLFAGLGALLLFVDAVRPRRRRWLRSTPATAATRSRATAVALWLCILHAERAQAQSAWAKGDQAFRAGRWAQAESLYAIRARRGAPAPVQVNRATALAKLGRAEDAERALSRLSAGDDRSGRAAGYNLGTLLGERGEIDTALGELRRAIERDPDDADARWNYEWLLRKQQERKREQARDQGKPAPGAPDPQAGGASGSGSPPSAPSPSPGSSGGSNPLPPAPGGASPSPGTPPPGGGAPGMTRAQAEQLLGSLGELERLEQQRMKRTRVVREKRGKDW